MKKKIKFTKRKKAEFDIYKAENFAPYFKFKVWHFPPLFFVHCVRIFESTFKSHKFKTFALLIC